MARLTTAHPATTPPNDTSTPAVPGDNLIFRRYFLAAMAIGLTAGAAWGATMLWRIGFLGSFIALPIPLVNAHGQAQIFGWMGLFIMGFAYQAFPRFWKTRLVAPYLAAAVFVAMLAGTLLRAVMMPLADGPGIAAQLVLTGGVLQLAAVVVFAAQILFTFRNSSARLEPWSAFAFAAIGWFIIQTLMSAWHGWAVMTAASFGDLLWQVATYQAPLRDLQLHGLALFMILGVSLRVLPAMFGVRATPPRWAWWSLGILTLAVIGKVTIFIAYRWTDDHSIAALLMAPWVMLVIGVALVAWPWRLWRPLPNPGRGGKFVRAAYLWLAISLLMLLLLPVHQIVSGLPFSHAYYGAIRHAMTVGFITLMILGIASKFVPVMLGVDDRRLSALWGPFILVNLGCLLRVSLQTLSDWHAAAFALVGVSGTLEAAGLAWWSLHLVGIMWRSRRGAAPQSRPAAVSEPVAITIGGMPCPQPAAVALGAVSGRIRP